MAVRLMPSGSSDDRQCAKELIESMGIRARFAVVVSDSDAVFEPSKPRQGLALGEVALSEARAIVVEGQGSPGVPRQN